MEFEWETEESGFEYKCNTIDPFRALVVMGRDVNGVMWHWGIFNKDKFIVEGKKKNIYDAINAAEDDMERLLKMNLLW